MAFEKCSKCGGLHWSTDACKESTAPRKDVGEIGRAASTAHTVGSSRNGQHQQPEAASGAQAAGTQALPVDTLPAQAAKPLERVIPQEKAESDDTSMPTPPARSNTKRDRNPYMRQYMVNWRAKRKANAANKVVNANV